MRFHALATDYDGTLAHNGSVDGATIAALERLRASGRRIIMVTGREVADLSSVFQRLDLFDVIVAENGALLYFPKERREILLAEPPPEQFVAALRDRRISPLSVGRVVVASWEPQSAKILETIQ